MPVTTRSQSRKRKRGNDMLPHTEHTKRESKQSNANQRTRKPLSRKQGRTATMPKTTTSSFSNLGTTAVSATTPLPFTQKLWSKQDQHKGDRWRLFQAVGQHLENHGHSRTAMTVLYPGSFVDIAPSFVFPNVVYVDLDKRAKRFFGDESGM